MYVRRYLSKVSMCVCLLSFIELPTGICIVTYTRYEYTYACTHADARERARIHTTREKAGAVAHMMMRELNARHFQTKIRTGIRNSPLQIPEDELPLW